MIIGLLIGLLIGTLIGGLVVAYYDINYYAEKQKLILIFVIIVVVAMVICGIIGVISDCINQAEFIATWEANKTSYEQAMNAYDNYESWVKDNPELIKNAVAKNEELAKMKYQATRWWNFYLDDSIANLQPINIGTN